MVRHVDYESRKRAVLAATINQYIQDAEPVSSEQIARIFDLSPATIRNIFVALEKDGYITHPYTSGGRVPTKKGYRYYVDFLLEQMQFLEDDKERIDHEYPHRHYALENILEKTSDVISAVTHYAGIASFLEWDTKFFYKGVSLILEQPEFHDYAKVRLLIRMLEERQRFLDVINRDFEKKVTVYIGDETGCPEMDGCALVVSSYRIKNKPVGRVAALGPARMEYQRIIPTMEYISDVLSDTLNRI